MKYLKNLLFGIGGALFCFALWLTIDDSPDKLALVSIIAFLFFFFLGPDLFSRRN
jgi:hypothetical protein